MEALLCERGGARAMSCCAPALSTTPWPRARSLALWMMFYPLPAVRELLALLGIEGL